MNPDKNSKIETINALLPQTQCGLCTYEGCRPYAKAIVEDGDALDRCLPGGVTVLKQLGEHCQVDTSSLEHSMREKARAPAVASIREDECIGCTKCIQACPVDAIIGSAKQMHSIIAAECTGCELCVEPCPVDCIDITTLGQVQYDKALAERRYEQKQIREQQKKQAKLKKYQEQTKPMNTEKENALKAKQDAIAAAVARVKAKQTSKRMWQYESTTT